MTDRFTIFGKRNKDFVIDEIRDNGNHITVGEVVDLLNKLHNENEVLIQGILMKEEIINNLKDDIKKCNIQCRKLGNENEQLKKILNELSNRIQFDVENGIRSYPVKLSEYLSNALKELCK